MWCYSKNYTAVESGKIEIDYRSALTLLQIKVIQSGYL